MKESDFSLPVADGKTIYGRHTVAAGNLADRVVILSHGLTGEMLEAIHMNATDHFTAHGYDILKFNYYGGGENARLLEDTTLQIHAYDLNQIVAHARSLGYAKIYICGHSYGGCTILFAQPEVTALAFWDSTFVGEFWRREAVYLPEIDRYSLAWGYRILIGKAMYEERLQMTRASSEKRAQAISQPSLVIGAEETKDFEEYDGLYDALRCEKRLVVIPKSDHRFTRPGNMAQLFDETRQWFEAHS